FRSPSPVRLVDNTQMLNVAPPLYRVPGSTDPIVYRGALQPAEPKRRQPSRNAYGGRSTGQTKKIGQLLSPLRTWAKRELERSFQEESWPNNNNNTADNKTLRDTTTTTTTTTHNNNNNNQQQQQQQHYKLDQQGSLLSPQGTEMSEPEVTETKAKVSGEFEQSEEAYILSAFGNERNEHWAPQAQSATAAALASEAAQAALEQDWIHSSRRWGRLDTETIAARTDTTLGEKSGKRTPPDASLGERSGNRSPQVDSLAATLNLLRWRAADRGGLQAPPGPPVEEARDLAAGNGAGRLHLICIQVRESRSHDLINSEEDPPYALLVNEAGSNHKLFGCT
ncbi:unnamed protein product, partial [Polarella glacialis]